MFGTTYRYSINPDAGTIKLAPTKGMWIATLAVTVLPWVVLSLIGYSIDKKEQEAEAHDKALRPVE